MNNGWFVYIVECKDGELYVGIAKDVQKRVEQHNKGSACRYTMYRWPVKLLYRESQLNYNNARKRERELKGFTRAKKLATIFDDASVA